MPRGKAAVMASPKKSPAKKAAPKRAKKDDGKVKRPLSAYIIYTMERRPELVAQKKYAGATIGELAKKMGAEWQLMGETARAPYNRKHESSVRKQRALGYEPGVKKAKSAAGTLRVRRTCQEKMDMCVEHEADVAAKRASRKKPRKSASSASRGSPAKTAAAAKKRRSSASKSADADKAAQQAVKAAEEASAEAMEAEKAAKKAERAARKAAKAAAAASPAKSPPKAKKSKKAKSPAKKAKSPAKKARK
jgi:hypothetical protein